MVETPTQMPSLGWRIFFWLLWLVGLGVLVLFSGFLLITAVDAPFIAIWNALVVVIEIYLLFKTARHFVCKDQPLSEILLWVAAAAFAMPLLGMGGCLIVSNMGNGLRFAG